jgi:plasmid maintenance system antidote protein VapI
LTSYQNLDNNNIGSNFYCFTKKRERRVFRQEVRRSPNTPHKEAVLSIASFKAPGKPNKPIRLRPLHREGLKILYKVKDSGASFTQLAQALNLNPSSISNVVSGRRRSARIEAEIARILGKADWNEVVLEARSEIQKKPVKAILEEMRRTREGRLRAAKESLGEHVAQGKARVAAQGRGA